MRISPKERAVTLSDALSQFQNAVDQSHKFWGYYQAFSAAAIAFAWASDRPPKEMVYGMVGGYALFALFNCRLVYASQKSALAIWYAIQTYVKANKAQIPAAFRPLPALNRPDRPSLVATMHLVLSVLVCVAIYAAPAFGPQPSDGGMGDTHQPTNGAEKK